MTIVHQYLDFEKPIAELEGKIEELRRLSEPEGINIAEEVARLSEKVERLLRTTYAKLTPWQKTQVARHPERPKAEAYIAALITDFTPLAGDRAFADDAAVIGGLGRFAGRSVMAIGTEKGSDTESRIAHNFGMSRPEGYRKARRLIELAGRFGLPVLSFVDTAGAFPGIDAEAHGQAEAIARAIEASLEAPVPFIATIIGEGGSGGAIALAAGDRVLMLEHAIYSVISPEGCASILWRDDAQGVTTAAPTAAPMAAEQLKLTAEDLKRLALIDAVIAEPLGGAHRDPAATIAAVGRAIEAELGPLLGLEAAVLKARRGEKFLQMGRELA
ncbi:MAG TPA: acetyl-CoA carboxylase carboxyltransferase subunit alpha [Acetobacteraceae bacterium]|jgi:acetyl-CoA carboxylase carboxyl transferase subunit alpha|nr:acetyl-CoA carboxylase carboxyltransferase subunit alpha [Acetobacteraceae bacterium]